MTVYLFSELFKFLFHILHIMNYDLCSVLLCLSAKMMPPADKHVLR
jgi:hypothetical protein